MLKKDINETFRILKSDFSNPYKIQELSDVKDINLNKKSLVILCGNTTKSIENASKYISYAYNWLDGSKTREKITTYALFYPREQPLYNNLSANPTFDYETLTYALFDSILTEKDKLLPADEITKRLNNVVFFGHSVGGMVMDEIMYNLTKFLVTSGYSRESIRRIYKSIVFMGYSPFEVVNYPIKTIYIAPLYDSLGSVHKTFNKVSYIKHRLTTNPALKLRNNPSFDGSNFAFYESNKRASRGVTVSYIAGDNTFIAAPNLMYDDGIKEDHNLAGAIDYQMKNPYKTQAGEATTNLMHRLFRYVFEADRKNLNTRELFYYVTTGTPRNRYITPPIRNNHNKTILSNQTDSKNIKDETQKENEENIKPESEKD